MRMNGSVRAPTATRMSSVPVLVDEPHPGQVGAEQLAGALDDQVQRGVDVGLGGLDLHPDLDQRLVGRRAPRLHLDLLDQQRQMLGEHRHQRAGVAGADAAAQVGHERAADRAVGPEHRLDAVDQRRARAVPERGRQPLRRALRGPRLADALGGDHLAVAPTRTAQYAALQHRCARPRAPSA